MSVVAVMATGRLGRARRLEFLGLYPIFNFLDRDDGKEYNAIHIYIASTRTDSRTLCKVFNQCTADDSSTNLLTLSCIVFPLHLHLHMIFQENNKQQTTTSIMQYAAPPGDGGSKIPRTTRLNFGVVSLCNAKTLSFSVVIHFWTVNEKPVHVTVLIT